MNSPTNSHKIHARQARTTGKPHIPITEPAVGVAGVAGSLKKCQFRLGKLTLFYLKIDTFVLRN